MKRRRFLHTVAAASVLVNSTVPQAPTSEGEQKAMQAGKKTPQVGAKKMRVNTDRPRNRNQNRSTVVCQNGIVCASQPLAALAGVDMLRAGGSAIDAAIAANAVLGVVEPMSCGIGGDLFAIVWSEKDRKLYGLNASGRAPYNWNLDAAKKHHLDAIPLYSPLAWNVPGCVSGWAALHSRFGRLTLAQILEPAIRYAREGFPVSPVIASHWEVNTKEYPTLAKTFAPDGRAPRYGEVFKNASLAASLERLAREGPDVFYKGEIAERIVKFSQANGGYFSMRDFADHTADWVEPVSTNYRGWDVWEIPPNGQGIAVLQMLNILETFDIGALAPNSAEHLHLFIEAKKLVFEDRAVYYADPEFADVPIRWLISKEYGRERAKLIDPKRASEKVTAGLAPGGKDTIYLTAADPDGNMISFIQSIYHLWGSHIVPDDLGFCLQNRGAGFSLDPASRNRLEPRKRPFHTIIPAFLTRKGRPVMSFGVMGGEFQPQGHVQVLMNLLDFGMSPQRAGDQPRIEHVESSEPTGKKAVGGGMVGIERGIASAVQKQLAAMGHKIRPGVGAYGGYQGIWREENPRRWFGGSDPRKDGCAIGY
ncbi:MAG: gamma-glutamyltransferase [Candidatus Sumerlaeia bacterium]|nr:gamma-glutamyltransferase [Candidatus Sumerlaeia bacterium]